MKKFLLKLLIFSFVIAIGAILINAPFKKGPHTVSTFMGAMADKHKRLDSLKDRRILLVGGSNLAFGFDSQALQDSFSLPVVNLGLHAGLGLSFILEEAKRSIRSGDVVLLSIEYGMAEKGDLRLEKTASYFYTPAEGYYTHNGYDDLKLYLDYTHAHLDDLLAGQYSDQPQKDDTINVYSREAFNAYGDVVAHLDKGPAPELKDRGDFNANYREVVRDLQRFSDYAQSRNVRVFYFFPPYAASEYKLFQEKIAGLSADIRKSPSMKVPDEPGDFIYSDSLFYDTVNHLNGKGRARRTARVIECLKQFHLPARSSEL